jgi:hypothetical protein
MRHLRHHAAPARTDGREWDGGTGRDKVVDFCFSVPWAAAGPCRSRKGRCAVDCAGLLAFKAHLDLLNFLINRWVKYHVKYKLPIYVQNQIFTFFQMHRLIIKKSRDSNFSQVHQIIIESQNYNVSKYIK